MRRNSITPSRAFLTVGVLVLIDRRLAVRARPAVAHRPGAGGDRLRRALQFDEAHAAIAGDRQPLVEAEARDLGPRGLAACSSVYSGGNLDLDAVDDELGHAFSLGGCESFASRFRGPETIENGKLASPRLRGEGCRRQQACAAGEGEGAVTKEALRHGQRLLRDRPLTPASLRSARSAEGRTLSRKRGEANLRLSELGCPSFAYSAAIGTGSECGFAA